MSLSGNPRQYGEPEGPPNFDPNQYSRPAGPPVSFGTTGTYELPQGLPIVRQLGEFARRSGESIGRIENPVLRGAAEGQAAIMEGATGLPFYPTYELAQEEQGPPQPPVLHPVVRGALSGAGTVGALTLPGLRALGAAGKVSVGGRLLSSAGQFGALQAGQEALGQAAGTRPYSLLDVLKQGGGGLAAGGVLGGAGELGRLVPGGIGAKLAASVGTGIGGMTAAGEVGRRIEGQPTTPEAVAHDVAVGALFELVMKSPVLSGVVVRKLRDRGISIAKFSSKEEFEADPTVQEVAREIQPYLGETIGEPPFNPETLPPAPAPASAVQPVRPQASEGQAAKVATVKDFPDLVAKHAKTNTTSPQRYEPYFDNLSPNAPFQIQDMQTGKPVRRPDGMSLRFKTQEQAMKRVEEMNKKQKLQSGFVRIPTGAEMKGAIRNLARPHQTPPKEFDADEATVWSKLSVGEQWKSKESFDSIYTKVIDGLHPLATLDKIRTGKPISELSVSESLYKQARLTAGSAGAADHMVKYGTYDWETGKNNGVSLKEAIAPVHSRLNEFRVFLLSLRNRELIDRGFDARFDPDVTQRILDKYKNDKEFHAAAKDVNDWSNRVLKFYKDSGMLSEESYKKILSENLMYVPTYRVEEAHTIRQMIKRGLTSQPQVIKSLKLKESGKQIVDPIESYIRNAHMMTNAAVKNSVISKIAGLASDPSMGALIKKVENTSIPRQFELNEIKASMKQAGVDVDAIDLNEVTQIWRPVATKVGGRNIISRVVDGKREYFEVHPDLYAALEHLDTETGTIFGRLLQKFAATLRSGATGTIGFPARNAVKDVQAAVINTAIPGNVPFRFAQGVHEIVSQGESYREWLKSGGSYSTLVSIDRKPIQESMRDLIRNPGWAAFAKDIVVHPIDAVRALNNAIENATKVGEFKAVSKAGGGTKEAKQEGAFSGREVATDFSIVGSHMHGARRIIAFFNASLQGEVRTLRQFKDHPARSIMTSLAVYTAPTLAYMAWIMSDDKRKEWYYNIPEWQRRAAWNFPTTEKEGGGFNRIAIPKLYGPVKQLFINLPTSIIEAMDAQSSEPVKKQMWQDMLEQGAAPVPTAALPLLENIPEFGWSSFKGRPLISKRLEDTEPGYRSDTFTSQVSDALGQKMNVSPQKIDNIVQGWSASIGKEAVRAVGQAGAAVGILSNKPSQQYRTSDIPIVSSFIKRSLDQQPESVNLFYDYFDRQTKRHNTIKKLKNEGRVDQATRLGSQPNAPSDNEIKALNQISDDLSDLRKKEIAVISNGELSRQQKDSGIAEIRLQQSKITKPWLKTTIPTTIPHAQSSNPYAPKAPQAPRAPSHPR